MKAVIINGATSVLSRTSALTNHVKNNLIDLAVGVKLFDYESFDANTLLLTDFKTTTVLEYQQAIIEADLIIVASPVYQGSFSGVLKLLLDLIPQKGLSKKKVLPLATGGSLAHLLMLDYSLKPVLSALGATHILAGVYASNQDFQLDETGYLISQTIQERLDAALDDLVTELCLSLTFAPRIDFQERQYL